MDLAQGRASSYVTRDMGAMESLRWHAWHFSWKIGAMSLVKVTGLAASPEVLPGSAAINAAEAASNAPEAMPTWNLRVMNCSLIGYAPYRDLSNFVGAGSSLPSIPKR